MRTFTFDNSALVAEAKCGLQSWLRYGQHRNTAQPRHAAEAGTAFHLAAESALRGESQEIAASKAAAYYSKIDLTGAKDRLSPANVDRVTRAWLKRHPVIDGFLYAGGSGLFKINPDMVEIAFQIPLGHVTCPCDDDSWCDATGLVQVDLTGRIDAIVQMDSAYWCVDWKTTGLWNARWLAGLRNSSQVSTYTWAAKQHLGRERVAGMIIGAVHMAELNSSSHRCPKHEMSYAECAGLPEHFKAQFLPIQRTEEQLSTWRKNALFLAQRAIERLHRFPTLASVKSIKSQGEFTDACDWCPFNVFCQMDRQNVEGLLIDKWNPLAPRGQT